MIDLVIIYNGKNNGSMLLFIISNEEFEKDLNIFNQRTDMI
jgi:hypothetical protein